MPESIVTITEAEELKSTKGKYLKVKTVDSEGKPWTYTIFDSEDWTPYKQNATLIINWRKEGNFRRIESAKVVSGDALPPEVKPEPPSSPDDKDVKVSVRPPNIPGQQVGMVTKELGDLIRSDKVFFVFGEEAGRNLISWYRTQILGTTQVAHDGAKLPKFVD